MGFRSEIVFDVDSLLNTIYSKLSLNCKDYEINLHGLDLKTDDDGQPYVSVIIIF